MRAANLRFSRRTLARLAERMESALNHGELQALFFEYRLERHDPDGNKLIRSTALLRAIEQRARDADRIVIEILERLFANEHNRDSSPSLHQALRLDGFVFQDGRIVQSEPGPVAMAPETSALEDALQTRQLDVPFQHYRQAVDNFTNEQLEACNGQIRSFLEALFVEIGMRLTSRKFGNANAALQHLYNRGHLDQAEWNMFRYFWSGVQDNGPHAGLTTHDEALYRLHVGTAIGRYLVKKLE